MLICSFTHSHMNICVKSWTASPLHTFVSGRKVTISWGLYLGAVWAILTLDSIQKQDTKQFSHVFSVCNTITIHIVRNKPFLMNIESLTNAQNPLIRWFSGIYKMKTEPLQFDLDVGVWYYFVYLTFLWVCCVLHYETKDFNELQSDEWQQMCPSFAMMLP